MDNIYGRRLVAVKGSASHIALAEKAGIGIALLKERRE